MPTTVKKYKVFLASPGDVSADREVVKEAFEEINRLIEPANVIFQLVRWETDSTSGVAEAYSQQILNEQLLQDIDITVAIFGARVGTATPVAPSATIEEIRKVLNDKSHPMAKNRLKVFFKRVSVDNFDSDLDQLRKLREFREEVQTSAVYYQDYKETLELARLIRTAFIPLANQLSTDATKSINNQADTESIAAVLASKVESDTPILEPVTATEQLEFLDYRVIFENKMESANEALSAGRAALEKFASGTAENTEKLESASTIGSAKLMLDALNDQSELMQYCAEEMLKTASTATQDFGQAFDSMLELVNLEILYSTSIDKKDVDDLLGQIDKLEKSSASMVLKLKELGTTVEGLPNLSRGIRISKIELINALESFVNLDDQVRAKSVELRKRVDVAASQ